MEAILFALTFVSGVVLGMMMVRPWSFANLIRELEECIKIQYRALMEKDRKIAKLEAQIPKRGAHGRYVERSQ